MPTKRLVRIRLTLSTMLLLLTLAAVGVAYYQARDTRIHSQAAMSRMRIAAGLTALDDPEVAQISVLDSHSTMAAWNLWIPYTGHHELRFAYRGFHNVAYSQNFESVELARGRHDVKLLHNRDSGSIQLLLDDEVIASREGETSWNVSYPWDATDHETLASDNHATLVKAFGKAHLAVDEVYGPDKHRFGLHVWLCRLP